MGRVLRHEIIAIRCELRNCGAYERVGPIPLRAEWQLQDRAIQSLIERGWAFVLTAQLRSYCPAHAARVWRCGCKAHPDRVHLCTVHDSEAAALVRVQQASLNRREVAA